MFFLRHPLIATAFLVLTAGALVQAEGVLGDEERTNGSETLKALTGILEKASLSSVLVGKDRDTPAISGTIVSADGYLLTKASEVAQLNPLNVIFRDGSISAAREVKRDEKRDLLLLKIERGDLTSVTWSETKSLRPAQWLCATTKGGQNMRIGVVSATQRVIPNSGAVMGIRMATDRSVSEGVVIERVTEESPAEKAGLKARDTVIALNGKPVKQMETVREVLSKMRPGDVVKLRYKRAGEEAECEVRLASRSRVEFGRSDFANHGTSMRTDNFPEVIQHDMPLGPADMGGAVYDLQGHAVGLNIARVDRVTNFALPSEVFQTDVKKWIEADRATRK